MTEKKTLDEATIDADEKLCNSSTPRPWRIDHQRDGTACGIVSEVTEYDETWEEIREIRIWTGYDCHPCSFEDEAVIVRAVNALPEYIAEIRRQRKEIEHLKKSLTEARLRGLRV